MSGYKYVVFADGINHVLFCKDKAEAMKRFDEMTKYHNYLYQQNYLTCAEMGVTEVNFDEELLYGTDAIWVEGIDTWVRDTNEIWEEQLDDLG